MKKLISLIALAILAINLQSCSTDKDPEAEGNHRHQNETPKVYTYKLSFGGDYIDQSEEPLTREGETPIYVGINVTRSENTVNAPVEKYAHGVFTHKDGITIEIIEGYKYEFEATVLTNKTDIYKLDNDNNYPTPFSCYADIDNDHRTAFLNKDINSFLYTFDSTFTNESMKRYLPELSSGKAYVNITNFATIKFGECAYPRVNRYYGKTTIDATVFPSGKEINIPLDYKCFGLRFQLGDVPKGTYITWQDITAEGSSNQGDFLQFNKDFQLDSDHTPYEDIYSLNNLNQSTQNLKFRFTWHKGDNSTETFEREFNVNAGRRKILTISVSGNSNIPQTGNIKISMGDSSLKDEDEILITNKQP